MNYDHQKIENKWQQQWQNDELYKTPDQKDGAENFYQLIEFPYPSGNLHVGHWYAFAVPDILARMKRMQGYNVLYPIGFDAFGLPAENAAIKRGLNPRTWTEENMEYMRGQIASMGASFDRSREVVTCDPAYYKWTQWQFIQLFHAGLVDRVDTAVNWCPSCKTVLANEQVVSGTCERCDSDVAQKTMKQWNVKITQYADRLVDDLEALDWPEEIKTSQRNWIGRKEGINITYNVNGCDEQVVCFTTRPDTNFGATFVVLSPEHPFVQKILKDQLHSDHKEDVAEYVAQALRKTEMQRLAEGKTKTGVFTGWTAKNTLNGIDMPIWISDFVLSGFGTGAVVGVPGHDERDYDFATAFAIPIKRVVVGTDGDTSDITQREQVQAQEGTMINSGPLDGLPIHEATEKIKDHMEEHGFGERVVSYRLRDWTVSRQRYWGTPIPMIHCAECGVLPVPDDQLPVVLPEVDDYLPRDDGRSPLAKAEEWLHVDCPNCGGPAERETDTLDTFIDSSWYFLRYTDAQNDSAFADAEKLKQWMPVDLYSGGAEHTTMHLLYSRFWHKALFDLGLVQQPEPYARRMNRGLILGPDHNKMSKSKGNVIDPDDIVAELGADTMRTYLAFIGPYNETGQYPWNPDSVHGVRKFFDRVWRLQERVQDDADVTQALNEMIQKCTQDMQQLKFNTAIAAMMTFLKTAEKGGINQEQYKTFLRVLAPFAPHITEELWYAAGEQESIHLQAWPEFDEKAAAKATVTLAIQINGKLRATIDVAADMVEADAVAMARGLENVAKYLTDEPKKTIYVPGRLINFVV